MGQAVRERVEEVGRGSPEGLQGHDTPSVPKKQEVGIAGFKMHDMAVDVSWGDVVD